jgi:SAM-dependent methyltransferase
MGATGDQAAVWSGAGGGSWVRLQDTLDGMYSALADLLVDQVVDVAPHPAASVIDVGCGTGATTLALARRLGPGASVTGVDVSEAMLAAARGRAAGADVAVDFLSADAQRHPFDLATADVIASRFGVMFFDDPEAAFANLRAATRPGGALRAIVWRGPEQNPFMTTAQDAAADVLAVTTRPPGAPGQFGLADGERTARILHGAGWHDVAVDAVDVECTFPASELTAYLGSMGPVGLALAEHDQATRTRVVEHVRPAFDRFVHGDHVRFTAACWLLSATT